MQRILSLRVIIGLLVAVAPASAAEVQPPSRLRVDARALEIVQQASRYLSQAQHFRFRAQMTYDTVQSSGQKLQFSAIQDMTVRRPNRVMVSRHHDDGTKSGVWYDGVHVTLYNERDNVYGTLAVPDTIDATLAYVEERGVVPLPVADLLYSDMSFLWKRAEAGSVVGESLINGRRCYHLAFRNATSAWQLWIAKGPEPLFCKMLITYIQQTAQPQFAAHLTHWDLSPQLSEALFVFTPPAGAHRIRFLAIPSRERDQPEEKK